MFVVCLVIGWFSGFLTVFEGGGVYHFRLFPMGIDRKRQPEIVPGVFYLIAYV